MPRRSSRVVLKCVRFCPLHFPSTHCRSERIGTKTCWLIKFLLASDTVEDVILNDQAGRTCSYDSEQIKVMDHVVRESHLARVLNMDTLASPRRDHAIGEDFSALYRIIKLQSCIFCVRL